MLCIEAQEMLPFTLCALAQHARVHTCQVALCACKQSHAVCLKTEIKDNFAQFHAALAKYLSQ